MRRSEFRLSLVSSDTLVLTDIFRFSSLLQLLDGRGIPPTQLSSNQASNMINTAAKIPGERRAAIDRIRQQGEFGPKSKAAAWGIEIEPTMMPITGRVLPAPKVQYNPSSGRGTFPFVNFG
jgi:hypothetical protein